MIVTMRVLMISHSMDIRAAASKGDLLAEKCEFSVISPKGWPYYGLFESVVPTNWRIIRNHIFFNGRNHFYIHRGLRRLFETIRPDVIHLDEEPYSLVSFQVVRLAKKLGVPVVGFTWQNIYKRYPFPFSWTEKYVLRNLSCLIGGNLESLDVFWRKGYSGETALIPQFGVEKEWLYACDWTQRQSFVNGQLHLGYLGRLVREKGIDLLIDAIKDISQIYLHIVGGGPELDVLIQQVKRYNLSERILFVEPLYSDLARDYMRKLNVLVLPSRTQKNWKEQFGRVLTEAMASGTVVIGSDSGEIPNVIGDAGLVFKEGDEVDLRKQITKLLDEDLRVSLAQKGIERVQRFYTQEHLVGKLSDVYEKICKMGGKKNF